MEKELLQAFLQGEEQAFEQLVLLHRKGAVLFALRLTADLAAAEDAVQEAFAWMLCHHQRIDPARGFKPLLYTIIRRRCVDWFRLWRKVEPLDIQKPQYAPQSVYANETTQALYAAIGHLATNDARIIHLLDIEGFSQKEAAVILGKTPGAVKTQHHRAKQRLKQLLYEEGFVP